MVWGYIKAKLRRESLFSFTLLKNRIDPLLKEEIPISFVRKVSRHCFRFMNGYRLGLKGPELDYAMKKYKGHRRIPQEQVQNIKDEFKDKQQIKMERNVEEITKFLLFSVK